MPNVFDQQVTQETEPPIGPPPEDRPTRRGAENIRAVFIGKDGSMGYKNGRSYELVVSGSSIRRADRPGWCPYGSLEAFFNNWRVVG